MPNINISLACKEIESIQPNSGCLANPDYPLAVSLAGVSTVEIIEEIGVVNALAAIDDDRILEYVRENIDIHVKENGAAYRLSGKSGGDIETAELKDLTKQI